ncbi:hypothetical protein DSCO28_03650 [Desulfosarcina ovata subsp. sediminis]|uniref:Flagellar hook-length control protein-like C-terminal domain-containing protein n=1 Tax=Desulfosarcina ovata subsp. sediminis TaxID=885957 RepID=A0A5K7ZJA7_9BACT|nr:flagellar hook-length control protein FliK [Desulfosarcina ovata]BBO79799.1 hypothetical protein DSCO28_03650 [Desulfosarcina ovata subsp. sediminis]
MELGSLIQSFMAPAASTKALTGTDNLPSDFSATVTGADVSDGQSFLQAIRKYLSGSHDRTVSDGPVTDSDMPALEETDLQLAALIAEDPALAAMVEMIQQDAVADSATEIESVASAFTEMDDDALMPIQSLANRIDVLPEDVLATGESGGTKWGKALLAFKAGKEKHASQPTTTDQLMPQEKDMAMPTVEYEEKTLIPSGDANFQASTQMDQTQVDRQGVESHSDNGRLAGPSASLAEGEMMLSENMPERNQRLFNGESQQNEIVMDDEPPAVRSPNMPERNQRLFNGESQQNEIVMDDEQPAVRSLSSDSLKSDPKPLPATGSVPGEGTLSSKVETPQKGENQQSEGDDAAATKKHQQLRAQDESTNTSFRGPENSDATPYGMSRSDSPSTESLVQNRTQTTTPLASPSQPAAESNFNKAVMDQIVEKAMIRSTDTGSEVRVQLKPDFLGDVRMSIISENNQLSVKMITDQQTTKEILESQLHHLRAELDKQGLVVDKIEVMVNTNTDQNQNREQFFQMFRDHHAGNGRGKFGEDQQQRRQQQQQEARNGGDGNRIQSAQENGISYFA